MMIEEIETGLDRFDLEQGIMKCWGIIEDIRLLNKNVLEGMPDGGELTTDDVSNYLLGLETIYEMKFNDLFHIFSTLIAEKKIL
jgi:hypothetical protein